jgi:hypothetical protein
VRAVGATAPARKSTRPAVSTARKSHEATPARKPGKPARSAPRRRRSHVTPIPGRLVPIAVGRTAGAVGGLADSGVVVQLTRGRLWIGALAVLLVGIVGLNVMALSLNASSSKTGSQADELKQQNSALRAQLAGEVSNERVQSLASTLGLIFPEAGAIRYLEPASKDAAEAARRLRSGELVAAEYVPPPPAESTTVVAPVEPEAPPAEAPAVTPETGPATTPPPPADAAPPATPVSGGAGGVASP